MKENVDINILPRRQDDGRIQVMTKYLNGKILASFNTWPYAAIRLTTEQYERYKPFLEKSEDSFEGLVEYWGEPNLSDNGLPKFINKLF